MEPKFRESRPCFKENGRPTATATRNSENVFPSLGGIEEYVGLPRTKFQWCGFDVFLAARRRVKFGFKAVSGIQIPRIVASLRERDPTY
jgi:hypothetical protein